MGRLKCTTPCRGAPRMNSHGLWFIDPGGITAGRLSGRVFRLKYL